MIEIDGSEKSGSGTLVRDAASFCAPRKEDLETGAAVDRYLADRLVPFAALADGCSVYAIPAKTAHVEARRWLARHILGAGTKTADRSVQIEGIGMTI